MNTLWFTIPCKSISVVLNPYSAFPLFSSSSFPCPHRDNVRTKTAFPLSVSKSFPASWFSYKPRGGFSWRKFGFQPHPIFLIEFSCSLNPNFSWARDFCKGLFMGFKIRASHFLAISIFWQSFYSKRELSMWFLADHQDQFCKQCTVTAIKL